MSNKNTFGNLYDACKSAVDHYHLHSGIPINKIFIEGIDGCFYIVGKDYVGASRISTTDMAYIWIYPVEKWHEENPGYSANV